MAAGPLIVDATMVDDYHGALEGLSDGVRRLDVGAHVLIAGLAASDAAIEGVDDNDNR